MSKKDKLYLMRVLIETTRVTFLLAIFPVLVLLLGVVIDKQLATTPMFIVISFFAGLAVMVYSLKKVKVKEMA